MNATIQTCTLSGAQVQYRDVGEGPCVVFVHGVYVAGAVWDATVEHLDGMRSIVPTLPMGAHSIPAPGADLSARAMAARIPELLDVLGLTDVTLVGNDTGGGLCLAALGSGHAGLSRIGRLVLTNCDSYEHFPPKQFKPIVAICRRLPPVGGAILRLMSSGPGRKSFVSSVCAEPPGPDAARPLFGAFPDSPAARRDAVRFTATLEPSVTLDAVDAIRRFDRPVLLAWGDRDRKFFPVEHAHRLERDFPDARIRIIAGAGAYVMVDRPVELAAAISEFHSGSTGS